MKDHGEAAAGYGDGDGLGSSSGRLGDAQLVFADLDGVGVLLVHAVSKPRESVWLVALDLGVHPGLERSLEVSDRGLEPF
jgi:hypothetical protein